MEDIRKGDSGEKQMLIIIIIFVALIFIIGYLYGNDINNMTNDEPILEQINKTKDYEIDN